MSLLFNFSRPAARENIRWDGGSWYAYEQAENRIALCATHTHLDTTLFNSPSADDYIRCFTRISCWRELPKALHEFGFISLFEYLAMECEFEALEPEREP